MKSKVESRSTCLARSARKIAAPLSTPTKITDWPAKSFVICAPNSTTRLAISCREISTLSSAMTFHIKLGGPITEKHAVISLKPAASQAARSQKPGAISSMNLEGVRLTWLGHPTFRMETPGGKTIFIDPWIMGNPMCPEAEKKVKKADVLLFTHGHGDH